jgi:hypothetical protein
MCQQPLAKLLSRHAELSDLEGLLIYVGGRVGGNRMQAEIAGQHPDVRSGKSVNRSEAIDRCDFDGLARQRYHLDGNCHHVGSG